MKQKLYRLKNWIRDHKTRNGQHSEEVADGWAREQLIEFFIKHKYYSIKDKKRAREFAIEDLGEIKKQYRWPIMKRAANHLACTGIGKFKKLCQEFKEMSKYK